MSVSREWNSLKAAWIILLLFLTVRIFLSGQYLLTPDEAVYWQASQYNLSPDHASSPLLNWTIKLSTSLFGNTETAVRLPALLGVSLATVYMILLAASMFSWHTALHVTLLSQGILQLNMAALIVSPYSLLLPCWTAACYHSSQAMHSKHTEQWLFAGFWFGLGMVCKFSMILLLPCLMMCFVLIKPFRTVLLYPGPWFGLMLSLGIFLPVVLWDGITDLTTFFANIDIMDVTRNLIPDSTHSIQFIIDQLVLLTPVVLLLIVNAWLTGGTKRHLVKADVYFLSLTSVPIFLLFFFFPAFADNGTAWSSTSCITALVLIAGLNSSTRSSFKGSPNRRWIICMISAYFITIPLVLQIAFPALPLPIKMSQTQLGTLRWDTLGEQVNKSFNKMPLPNKTFIFSMDPRLAGELSFYIPGNPRTVSLDHKTRSNRKKLLGNEINLIGMDGLGLVTTLAALEQTEGLFDRVEIEKKFKLNNLAIDTAANDQTYYIVRGFGFRFN